MPSTFAIATFKRIDGLVEIYGDVKTISKIKHFVV